ncbi:hypothetical protein VNO78_22212 [Psophocarpus tetragonolobus]|uniref:Uncharacterized protein n=1 Tax=Psophocarpus tetragonolobus TaxID=3891 RepID=A0AAN9XI88_PSOTE
MGKPDFRKKALAAVTVRQLKSCFDYGSSIHSGKWNVSGGIQFIRKGLCGEELRRSCDPTDLRQKGGSDDVFSI